MVFCFPWKRKSKSNIRKCQHCKILVWLHIKHIQESTQRKNKQLSHTRCYNSIIGKSRLENGLSVFLYDKSIAPFTIISRVSLTPPWGENILSASHEVGDLWVTLWRFRKECLTTNLSGETMILEN
jgi:hypothetical protein